MPQRVDLFDLETLQLRPGEGSESTPTCGSTRCSSAVSATRVAGGAVAARLDVSRTVSGYALRLRFDALAGGTVHAVRRSPRRPRSRSTRARSSSRARTRTCTAPISTRASLDLADWARDALVLAMPAQIVCSAAAAACAPNVG